MPAPCPPDDRLRAFDRGDLPDDELNAVAAHLGRCLACVGRMARLTVPLAPTLSELVADPASASEPDDTAYWRAVERAALAVGPADRPPLPTAGDTLRDYRLIERVGSGGMGVVFKAVHAKLDKVVAVKVLSGRRWHDPAAVARFEREMKAVGRLGHPNIVQATDAGDVDGAPFLVMEFVDGENLSVRVKRAGPLPTAEAVRVVRQAAAGLHHAHAAGVVHRDVKPSNLMLARDGTVKVLDLGLALPLTDPAPADAPAAGSTDDPAAASHLTSASHTIGTLDYMAPEQKRDAHAVDARADVYGLGCTLWFLLAGTPPRAGDATDPAELPGGLPAEVWRRFLASDPAWRFPDMAAVDAALATVRPANPRRRTGPTVALGALLAVVCAVVALVTLNRSPVPAPTEPTPAPNPEIGKLPLTEEQAADLQARWAARVGGPMASDGPNGTALRLIPPGEFMLSSQLRATITRPFRLAATEVTVAQFRRFVEATKHIPSAVSTGKGGINLLTFRPQGGDLDARSEPSLNWENIGHTLLLPEQPVCVVSWDDATAYCRWLGEQDRRAYRLPTAAEFTWATRCGDPSDEIIDPKRCLTLGWCRVNCDQPQPVGGRAANAWGLYDTHGNVAEWCHDRNTQLPVGSVEDYAGSPDPTHAERVFLGWSYLAPAFKPMPLRDKAPPDHSFAHVGFRVACDVP